MTYCDTCLEKISAEILDEAEYAYADFELYKVEYLGADAEFVEDDLPQDDFRYGMERAIEIIDKYKKAFCPTCGAKMQAESEENKV